MSKVYLMILALGLFLVSCEKEEGDPFGDVDGLKYKVTFDLNWNPQDFPTDYPGNAHFSKLIGWSHEATSTFFQTGTMASPGIESMAETGGTDILAGELQTRISSGEGLDATVGSNLSTGVGTIEVELAVDSDHPSITLATMVAPSPDWYVAVVNIELLKDGAFVDTKTVTAYVYDAGTDSGEKLTSPDEDTQPREPITLFVDSPFGDGATAFAPVGSVTFTKMTE